MYYYFDTIGSKYYTYSYLYNAKGSSFGNSMQINREDFQHFIGIYVENIATFYIENQTNYLYIFQNKLQLS